MYRFDCFDFLLLSFHLYKTIKLAKLKINIEKFLNLIFENVNVHK